MILSRVGCVFMTNCILGRAPRIKETMPDFLYIMMPGKGARLRPFNL